jgi:hypothetical protein
MKSGFFLQILLLLLSKLENAYQLYLSEIVSALDSLTNCSTIISCGTDQEQFRLNMGTPIRKTLFVIVDSIEN